LPARIPLGPLNSDRNEAFGAPELRGGNSSSPRSPNLGAPGLLAAVATLSYYRLMRAPEQGLLPHAQGKLGS
jgi:hypothetical protein